MTGEQLTEQLEYLASVLMWVVESLESTYKIRPCGKASIICVKFCFHVFSVLCSMQVKEMLIPGNRWFRHRFFLILNSHCVHCSWEKAGGTQSIGKLPPPPHFCPVEKKFHNCISISFERHY